MIYITSQQLNKFKADAINRANLNLLQYAKDRFPDLTEGRRDEDILGFILKVRKTANQYDLVEESEIATAFDLSVMYGVNFYSEAWVSEVFAVPEWSAGYKIEIIRERVRRLIPHF